MIALPRSVGPRLQATYVPEENGLAWWGADDVPAALGTAGLPVGRHAALRLAGVVASDVRPMDVDAYITELATTVPMLARLTRVAGLADSARGWRAASRAALRMRGGDNRAQLFPTAELATLLPPAGHAVLNAEETAVMAPSVLLDRFAEAYETVRSLLDADVRADLRSYQAHGVAWLRARADSGQGAVLADEMGLGKTLQAIALLATRTTTLPHLVVCPTSVVGNWQREIERFAPSLDLVRYHGSTRALPEKIPAGTVVLTSYPLLRSDPNLADVPWDVVVLDEAQQLKNSRALVTRIAASLEARSKVAMTGTPVENNLDELWSLLSVTDPGVLGARARFRQRFVAPIEKRRSATAATRLSAAIAPHVLRRTKAEVATELPPRVESTVACTLTSEQAMLYRRAVDRAFDTGFGKGAGRSGRILALLTELKQVCNHPAQYLGDDGPTWGRSGKFDRTSEIIAEIAQEGERALVFTQYKVMGDLLATGLGEALDGAPVPFLHGGLSAARRESLVLSFQEDDDAPQVLILSLRAAGFGLNLTRASHVVHYDRWWNPAVEEQATARAHRIGQRRTVNVHTLITGGTVEDHIDRMHLQKQGLADLVTGDPAVALTRLPDRELREVFDLDHMAVV